MRRMVNEKDIALMEDLNDNNISSKTISQLYIVDNIKDISNDILNKLKAGDIVLKNTNGQLHAYSVSFKKDDEGICLTYSDASVVETQSYDLIDGVWTYNSEDKTNLINYIAGDNISINNGVISATDTKYTAGDNISIEDGVISASGGDVWESNIKVTFRGLTEVPTTDEYYLHLYTKEELTNDNFITILNAEFNNGKHIPLTAVISTGDWKLTSIAKSGYQINLCAFYYDSDTGKWLCGRRVTTSSIDTSLVYSHKIN